VTHKKLCDIVPALARCHRLLVHSPNDMNRLKAYGLVDNVTVFPHGILDFIPQARALKPEKNDFVIGSYGFFLPHKGLLEFIEAMALLRKQGQSITLKMFNAEYPVADSRLLIEQARAIIKAQGLSDTITLCTDYLTDEQCLSELAKLDLIVFPYQETGESSSAAVRYGLASGQPVAVTPLAIFEDVGNAVFRLSGQSPTQIADGIKNIKKALTSESKEAKEVADTAAVWREQHRYSAVAKRLSNMILALHNNR
jgi:glycosyltransferase involved in cell wall biosynthesis